MGEQMYSCKICSLDCFFLFRCQTLMPTTFSRHSLEDQGVLALKVIEENMSFRHTFCCLDMKQNEF